MQTDERAARLRALPPSPFAELAARRTAAQSRGGDIIDLGIGNPDQPTPAFVVEALARSAANPAMHGYGPAKGDQDFRQAIATFFERRFDVTLDPELEVYPTIGSKEAIGHFPLAILEPGDAALIPRPGYPTYQSGTILAGGIPIYMELPRERNFLPDLHAISDEEAKRARLLYLNYPNAPTGVVATRGFFQQAVEFAARHDLIIVHDAAYIELCFGEPAPSILQVPGARARSIEFHSLSKTYNMAGWRVGFAVGDARLIAALASVKTFLDAGVFLPIQHAAAEALRRYEEVVPTLVETYRARRDTLVGGLRRLKWPQVTTPEATFFCWLNCPPGYTSEGLCARLLDEASIVMMPGRALGPSSEGYVRAALTVPEERIVEAVRRIGNLRW
jgi:LL-diaminopimelate aminotransferase